MLATFANYNTVTFTTAILSCCFNIVTFTVNNILILVISITPKASASQMSQLFIRKNKKIKPF